MGTHKPSFLKNTIAVWLAGHQDDLHPLSLTLAGISGSSLLFQANSRQIHMIVPSYVGSLNPPTPSSKEVFVVTSPEDPDSDQRFNSALMALNEKLERLSPDTDALHIAMEYLVAAMKKYQGKSFQSSTSSAHQGERSDDNVDVNDGDHSDHDDDDDCGLDEEGDDDYFNADEVDFGYDMASFEDANRTSTAFVEMRSKGYLYAMAIDAKQQCNRARQKFSSPPETARDDLENSILAWCSVEPVPGDLIVRIKMQVGGIVSDDAAAASLGLSLDFPMCISLQFSKDHWCRKENNRPLKVDACVVKATETKANMTKEEETQFANDLDKRHRFGEEIFLPELVKCYFAFLETRDKSIAKSTDILKDLTTQVSHTNVFVGLICFLAARLRALPNWCVVCWNTLPYNVGRLRTCDRELCLYRFEELGMGTTVLQEVQKYPELFDFEMSLAIAALNSDRDVFEPFPAFLLEGSELRGRSGWFSKKLKVETQPSINLHTYKPPSTHSEHLANKQLIVLRSILHAFPSVNDMQSCSNEVQLKKTLTTLWQNAPRQHFQDVWKEKLWLPYDVLRFLLSTSRLTMHSLQESTVLSEFKTAIYQFAVLHDNPEKEAHFEKRRKKMGGSFFAFHGSGAGNWYSILRNGLRSMSNTAYMSTGAAYGVGIYTASHMSTSFGYVKEATGWQHGKLHAGFSVMAICEIVNGSILSSISDIMVVPSKHEQDILIRYILVFPSGSNYNYEGDGIFITSTTLRKQNNSTDLLQHHRSVRQLYHEKKQSEWKESRKVRWGFMKAMCKKNEEEVEEQATKASLRAVLDVKKSCVSSSMPGCIQAIQKELKNIMNQLDAAKRKGSRQESDGSMLSGIEIDLPDETDLRRWQVHLSQHVFKGCPLYGDLTNHAKHNKKISASVKLECMFPDTFPMAPPFIRVISPRFKFHTGHVTVGGSICMELLTESGWSPAFCFESVLVQIISAMMEGGARLDFNSNSEYSEHEARAAFDRVARDHGWIKGK